MQLQMQGNPMEIERVVYLRHNQRWCKRHINGRAFQSATWPTYGQSGYVSPAVSGIPTAAERGGESEVAHLWAKWLRHPCRLGVRASERGAKSEVAHLWAKWLRHPCRLGDPHRFTAGGEIRSGPLRGKVATSPLPSRGSPPLHSGGLNQTWPTCGQSGYVTPAVSGSVLQSGGQNQKWPTCGQSGYVTPAVSGIPTAAQRGAKSEVAHLWAKWLRHPCRLGVRASERGAKSEVAHLWAKWLRHPCRLGVCASERGAKSEVAHLWAKWLRHPCRLGDPHRCTAGGKIRSGPLVGKVATSPLPSRGPCFRAGGKIRSGPLVGKVATSPLPSRGSPPLHSGGQNQKWPTCGQSGYVTPAVSGSVLQSGGQNQKWPTYGQSGYVTPAVSGIPTAAERGGKSEVARLWAKWLRHPCRLGVRASERGAKSEVAHLWAKWLRHPCRLGDPHRFRAGGKIRSGPLVGKVATSPLPSRGSAPLHSGGQNQKWPTCGQSGYVTPAVSGIPTAAQRGAKSEVAHLWAKWLRHPCRLGDPHRFRAGGEIRSGPLMGKVATSPLPSRGSPPLQSGGQNQQWPTYGQSGYVTPAVSGIPTAAQRGAKSEGAHLWAKWLRHPCRLGDPHRCRAGGKIRSGPLMGKVATSPLPSRGSPPLQSGGGNQKWPACGQSGYVTPAVSGSVLQSGGQNQKWPTCGQSGYVTPAVSGIPTASERGAKSEVAHLWAKWLRHPCRLGDPHRCTAGGKIRSGPLVGKVATSPLPSRGSPPLHSGGHNQKWPTCGQSGYATPAVSGIPTASERGGKSEVAHLWAKWLRHPCRLGDPHRFRAGGKIRSGPLMGKVATSPLPSRGSPPLHSGGQNQKWPTYGQSGYVTPAVSGIPTDAERGGKSEVAHLWAKWLRHPCRLGDPHRCRAGG